MNVNQDQLVAHIAEVKKEAKKFGFSQPFPITQPHIFRNRLIDHDFDFSATDPKKIMLAVWKEKV